MRPRLLRAAVVPGLFLGLCAQNLPSVPRDPRVATDEEWRRFEGDWDRYRSEQERALESAKERAQRVGAELERARNAESRINEAGENMAEVSRDAIEGAFERLTGSREEAAANAVAVARDFQAAYGQMLDAAGDLGTEGERARELARLDADIARIEQNIALSRQYVALHAHDQSLLRNGINPSYENIFARVSQAYQRTFQVAGQREQRREDERRREAERQRQESRGGRDGPIRDPNDRPGRPDQGGSGDQRPERPQNPSERPKPERSRPDPPRGDGPVKIDGPR